MNLCAAPQVVIGSVDANGKRLVDGQPPGARLDAGRHRYQIQGRRRLHKKRGGH
jgi:hypothetical protein